MATKRAETPAPAPRWRLTRRRDGTVAVEQAVFAYRVLFANGDVENVEATSDDSDLRAALLALRKVPDDRIAGVAQLGCVGWTSWQEGKG